MDLLIKNCNKKIIQSISSFEQFVQNDDLVLSKQHDNPFMIQLDQDVTNNTQLEKVSKKFNRSTRRKNKRSQKYLKEKGVKQDKERISITQLERFLSTVNKVSQQSITNHQIPKNIYAQIQKSKNPRIIQIAMRYGVYNEKPRNNFQLSIKKKFKNTCPTQKNQEGSSLAKQPNILNIRKRSASRKYQPFTDNKVSLGTLTVDPNHDKSISLMLDRKNITQMAKDYSSQNMNLDAGIIQRNKFLAAQVPCVKKNQVKKKIEFFIHQEFDIDLENIKTKISNNLNNVNQKTQIVKTNEKTTNKMAHKGFKNASQQIHVPIKIHSNKHASFTSIKKATHKSQKEPIIKIKFDKTQVIPASITFKKDKTNNNKIIEKNTKSNHIQDKKDIYIQFQSRIVENKHKQAPNGQNLQNLSIVQRPKTHKDSRIATDATVLRKSRRQLFSAKPCEFTFIFDSKDHCYISQYLISNGWSQFHSTKLNNIHTLKWVNNPVTSQILNLKEGQFYNHFHKSFELTSKNFLNSNLKANRHFLLTHQFFPDTYDIGNQTQKQEFIQNYKYNVMIELLQKIVLYCFKNSSQIKSQIEDILLLKELEDYMKQTEQQKKLQNQYFNAMEFENYKQPDEKFKLNIFLVILSLKFYQKQRRRYDIDYKQKKHNYLGFNKAEFDKNYDMLELYSQQQDVSKPVAEIGLYSYHYATPSELLLKLLIREYCFFSKINKWRYSIQSEKRNVSNIWIVKPSSNARGNGIYLEKNMGAMLKSAKDIQSRIVQKYIQCPLIFKNTKYPYLNNHKFDLRQWVLLKSLDPLEIYMFSHFYLRLASEKYQTKDIDNNKVHLTNFSANKEFFKSNQHSIVNSDEFLMFLKEECQVDWEIEIKPKIKEIIVKSIQSCQEKLQTSGNGTCFQLLGYDILIDQNFAPWLIEVNMSPACEQRTEQLSEYLKNMNEGLLEIVIPESYIGRKSSQLQRKQQWQKIYHEDYYFMGKEYDPKLQVVSVKYQQKQRLQKQGNQSKSKSSMSNSMSPTKFKKRSANQSSLNGQSIKKLQKECINQLFDQVNITTNKVKEQQNMNSFVVNDFIEEQTIYAIEETNEIGDSNKITIEEIYRSIVLDEILDESQSRENIWLGSYIEEFQEYN